MDTHKDRELNEFMEEAKKDLEYLYKTRKAAYDGSTQPQTRELLPLERDILVRVLTDIFQAIRSKDFNALYKVHRPFNQEEVDILLEVRQVIDPRG